MKNLKLEIKKMGINGEGIAYDNRKIVFVDGAIEGEIVEATVVEETKKYMTAKLDTIIRKVGSRVEPKCPIYKQCGACSMMHIDYRKQLQVKKQMVIDAINHYYPENKSKVSGTIASPLQYHYRNQAKLPVQMVNGVLKFGLYKRNSNFFVPINNCLIHEDEINLVLKELEVLFKQYKINAYDSKSKLGLRFVVVRHFKSEVQITFITGKQDLPQAFYDDVMDIKNVKSVYRSINYQRTHEIFGPRVEKVKGNTHIKAIVNDEKFIVSPSSFFQMNTKQTVQLYDFIKSHVKSGTHLLDAYCGVGSIGLYIREQLASIKGIEIIKGAVVDARENAHLARFDHANYEVGDALKLIPGIVKNKDIDCILVDPPRTGLNQSIIEAINKSKIQQVIYVSCNPSTLGKDLALFSSKYDVEIIQPVDMFPQTQHVETVVLMSNKKRKKYDR